MPLKKNPQSLRTVVDRMSEELAEVIGAEVQRRVNAALESLRVEMKSALAITGTRSSGATSTSTSSSSARVDQRRGGRICPVPGCSNPGAGPRNRWFCKEHARKLSVAEMKAIADRSKRGEAKLPTKVTADRIVRLPPKKVKMRRTLDMNCRVEGCTNRSRGPRTGFICDMHRAQLTPEEQLAAREQYKQRSQSRPVAAEQASLPPAPVPPIVRKAEVAEA